MILKKCRVCDSLKLKKVLSLGLQPLANNLANSKNVKKKKYPLALNICQSCFNCQLTYVVNPKKLFLNYLYKSSISKSFQNHFDLASKKYISMFSLSKKKSVILDVGSNDGIALVPYKNKGFKNLIGIEPSKNLANITKKLQIKTFNSFLNDKISKALFGKCDLILASNVFAHVNNIKSMTKNILDCLKFNGVLVIEVQYLVSMLRDGSFDNIYHEHVNYWSVRSLSNFFLKFNANIFRVEKINTHGGSIRVFIKKNINTTLKKHKSVNQFLNLEKIIKINNLKIYHKFKKLIIKKKKRTEKLIRNLQSKNKLIIGFGAPAKATTLINYLNLQKYIKYIVDENKFKSNKFIPNTKIEIISKPRNAFVDCVIVFAWNYFNEIKNNNKSLSNNFINIFNI
jgi:SAM-dependent methyltransferase